MLPLRSACWRSIDDRHLRKGPTRTFEDGKEERVTEMMMMVMMMIMRNVYLILFISESILFVLFHPLTSHKSLKIIFLTFLGLCHRGLNLPTAIALFILGLLFSVHVVNIPYLLQ